MFGLQAKALPRDVAAAAVPQEATMNDHYQDDVNDQRVELAGSVSIATQVSRPSPPAS